MSYLALYRKYRPNSFDDLVGQSEISHIIKNEILQHKVSHAYLFSGPRGTGKTSTAKIIAKMINCSNLSKEGVPCGGCESCLNFNSNSDIVEIDAASNNGVDEIRELRDKVNLVPTFGKYKVYIIDEVHMLTNQAFNALLKTLEEPPAHVVFILATTEFYKIPATVVSRCQKFQFLKFSNEDIIKRLSDIASRESISVSNDVFFEIARLSDGGLRDAINMLDQLSSFKDGELTVDDVYQLNGVLSYVDFKKLLVFISNNDILKIIEFMDKMDKTGKNFEHFIEDLICFVKDILVYKSTNIFMDDISEKKLALQEVSSIFSEAQLYDLIFSLNDLFAKLKVSSFTKILLVTEFIKFSNSVVKNNKNFLKSNINISNVEKENCSNNNNEVTKLDFVLTDEFKKIRINNAFATALKKDKDELCKNWYLVREKLSNDNKYISIAGLMDDVEVLVVGQKNIIFLAPYASILDRLVANTLIIEELLFDIFSINYKIVFLLKDEWLFEKEKYILNIKNGQKYSYIEEKESLSSSTLVDENNDIDKIVSILGEDIISYE